LLNSDIYEYLFCINKQVAQGQRLPWLCATRHWEYGYQPFRTKRSGFGAVYPSNIIVCIIHMKVPSRLLLTLALHPGHGSLMPPFQIWFKPKQVPRSTPFQVSMLMLSAGVAPLVLSPSVLTYRVRDPATHETVTENFLRSSATLKGVARQVPDSWFRWHWGIKVRKCSSHQTHPC
jgi:hypothetical protein